MAFFFYGVFKPASFSPFKCNPVWFSSLVQFVWAALKAAIIAWIKKVLRPVFTFQPEAQTDEQSKLAFSDAFGFGWKN